MITLTEEKFDAIIRIIARHEKLQAVKVVADVMKWGLPDSKAYVEALLESKP